MALDEPVYAAAIFVQDDTTLDVPMGFCISGSRVLYVAPGKTLTVDVVCDGTALSNAVSAAGGVYNSRILQGANYGDIAPGSLPDIGARYTVELVQVDGNAWPCMERMSCALCLAESAIVPQL